MINESTSIRLASPPEKFIPLATAALRAAATEIGLAVHPSWPQSQASLENQLLDVQKLVEGRVKKAGFAPSEVLFALAASSDSLTQQTIVIGLGYAK